MIRLKQLLNELKVKDFFKDPMDAADASGWIKNPKLSDNQIKDKIKAVMKDPSKFNKLMDAFIDELESLKVMNEAAMKPIDVKKLKRGDKLKINLKLGNGTETVEVMSKMKAGISKFDFITLKPVGRAGAPYTITLSRLEKSLV
jgi:hypothetical protein